MFRFCYTRNIIRYCRFRRFCQIWCIWSIIVNIVDCVGFAKFIELVNCRFSSVLSDFSNFVDHRQLSSISNSSVAFRIFLISSATKPFRNLRKSRQFNVWTKMSFVSLYRCDFPNFFTWIFLFTVGGEISCSGCGQMCLWCLWSHFTKLINVRNHELQTAEIKQNFRLL